jgi:hypothetical protein
VGHPAASLGDVFRRDIHTVDGGGRAQQPLLVLLLRDAVGLGRLAQLAAQHLSEELPRPARRLEELHVQGRERVREHVEYRIDLPLVGEHLGEVADPVTGADLAELRRQRGHDRVVVEEAGAGGVPPGWLVARGWRRPLGVVPPCVRVLFGSRTPRRRPPLGRDHTLPLSACDTRPVRWIAAGRSFGRIFSYPPSSRCRCSLAASHRCRSGVPKMGGPNRASCTGRVMRRLSGLPLSCRICRVYALTP